MINSLEHLPGKGSCILVIVTYLNYISGILSMNGSKEGFF